MTPLRKVLLGGALAAATVTGGAVGATFLGTANAATTNATAAAATGSSSSTPSSSGATPPAGAPSLAAMPAHGSAEHEDAEKAVTGTAATQAQGAAVKSVGSGTAGAVTTDFTGQGYEVTVTKSDGTQVEVHLDGSFNVIHGGPQGGPGGPGGSGGPVGYGQPPAAA